MSLMNGLWTGVMRAVRLLLEPAAAPPPPASPPAAPPGARISDVLARLQRSLAEMRVARGRLEAHAAQLRERSQALDEQARDFVLAGADDQARAALEQRWLVQEVLEPLETQLQSMGAEELRLEATEQRLMARLEALRTRDDLAATRYSAAQAQVRIGELIAGLTEEVDALGAELEATEVRAGEMQARAAALDRLIADGVLGPRDLR